MEPREQEDNDLHADPDNIFRPATTTPPRKRMFSVANLIRSSKELKSRTNMSSQRRAEHRTVNTEQR